MTRHFRLALEQEKLTGPNSGLSLDEKEIRSAELYTKLMFEQDDNKKAAPLKQSGVNGSYWIDKTVWGDKPTENEQKKTFIFKPMDGEQKVPGFPKGGSAAREMLGKAIGDQLQSAMGIDFGLPETSVVKVNSSKVPDKDGNAGPSDQERIGSIQHFAKSRGELKNVLKDDPDFIKKVPPEDVHKMAVLDLVQLNLDRHAGNFMVGEKDGPDGKVPKLIPIDHGLTFPSREGLARRGLRLGPGRSCLSEMPGADTKLGPEMVEKIRQMKPDDIVSGVKKSHEAILKTQPDAEKAANITDENFALTKRSIQFLQRACTELTVEELQLAYASHTGEIFDTDPNDPVAMEKGFASAIKSAKETMPYRKELNALMMKDSNAFDDVMKDLGWYTTDIFTYSVWLEKDPKLTLEIYKKKIPNPKVAKEITDLKEELKHLPPEQLRSNSPGLLLQLLDLRQKKQNLAVREICAKSNRDPKTARNPLLFLRKHALYEELGGDEALKQIAPEAQAQILEHKLELLAKQPFEQTGGEAAYEEMLKLYPATASGPDASPALKMVMLKLYEEYKRLGGDKEYLARGGSPESESLTTRLNDLKALLQMELPQV